MEYISPNLKLLSKYSFSKQLKKQIISKYYFFAMFVTACVCLYFVNFVFCVCFVLIH